MSSGPTRRPEGGRSLRASNDPVGRRRSSRSALLGGRGRPRPLLWRRRQQFARFRHGPGCRRPQPSPRGCASTGEDAALRGPGDYACYREVPQVQINGPMTSSRWTWRPPLPPPGARAGDCRPPGWLLAARRVPSATTSCPRTPQRGARRLPGPSRRPSDDDAPTTKSSLRCCCSSRTPTTAEATVESSDARERDSSASGSGRRRGWRYRGSTPGGSGSGSHPSASSTRQSSVSELAARRDQQVTRLLEAAGETPALAGSRSFCSRSCRNRQQA
jgi:hypothetical protein